METEIIDSKGAMSTLFKVSRVLVNSKYLEYFTPTFCPRLQLFENIVKLQMFLEESINYFYANISCVLNSWTIKFVNVSKNKFLANNSEFTVARTMQPQKAQIR